MKQHIILILAFFSLSRVSIAQAPTITSFSPASGSVGTLVTITGTNLSNPTAFTIGGSSALVISDDGSTLVSMVMPGASSGTVDLTTSTGSATSSANFTVSATSFPSTQQGSKLVCTGASGAPYLGYSVSLSADGNTAILGGEQDSAGAGAAWIFTRSAGVWSQQGSNLVGTGVTTTAANQGTAVALSADGNTAIIGGPSDNIGIGAAWVFTRSGTTWTQQGTKLVGTGGVGYPGMGRAVSISADGNTAMLGGDNDSFGFGAAWIFIRSGSTWTQQGSKLVGAGAINGTNPVQEADAVALSADGNTAIIGGTNDNNGAGAAWIFTRSGTTWTQQGLKLIGTGAVNGTLGAYQGSAVALSADGNTAAVGGKEDNSGVGATWVYTRSGSVWSQQGSKLVGTGSVGSSAQGYAVSISADGSTALSGGWSDNSQAGATWVFSRSGSSWTQQGAKLVGTGATGAAAQGLSVCLSADASTAITAGFEDNSNQGAGWIFTSVTTGLAEINEPQNISLYPNPNSGSFTLETADAVGGEYMITDLIGRRVANGIISSDSQVILEPLSPGMYLISASSRSGALGTMKYEILR